MLIKLLGTRGNIPVAHPKHRLHSGILIDHQLLFDAGEEKFLDNKPSHLFITHLHPDHAFPEKSKTLTAFNIPVYGPEPSKWIKDMIIINKPVYINDYTITPIPTIHSAKLLSQGYLIERAHQKIFYSADLISIPESYHEKLRDCDLVITEASFIRKGGLVKHDRNGKINGHAGVPDLVEFFSQYTSNILLTHFGSWMVKNPHAGLKKIAPFNTNKLTVTAGYDGMELKL